MTIAQPTVDVLPRRLAPLRELVVGVDGGGTRTRAVILSGDHILGEGTAGPSNPLRVGIANAGAAIREAIEDRKSTRLNSSHLVISYAVFCLKKKKTL